MNILFLTIGRINSISESGLYTDLIRKFHENGHNVFVVSPREKRLNMPTECFNKDGVNFLKVSIGNITKTNIIEKGISTIRIEHKLLKAIKKYMNNVKFDLILYTTPPITFSKVIKYIKDRDKAVSYLLLKDIFPQNAVDLNMFKKSNPIYQYFRYKEKKLYNYSDYIGCMSEANRDYIIKHNNSIPRDKVEVCPNSIDPLNINIEDDLKLNIRNKYNIPKNKTVFIYGGNLGKPQGIDFLIECIKRNEINSDAYFLIVGSGTEYKKIERFFNQSKLKNSKLLNYLPKSDYDMLANICDVGMIFLDNKFTIPNFPSRLLSYMQSNMPVLAATDTNTDIREVIKEGDFGYWCESKDVEEFNDLVNKLCDTESRKQMGKNSRQYLEKYYTTQRSYDIIMKHFN